jgi:hypothetical protein
LAKICREELKADPYSGFVFIFRNRNFLLLWLSQVISQAGSKMFQIGIFWWILSKNENNSGMVVAIVS